MKTNNKKYGFTLVEIMIVVAIIGLLAAIGIPSFMKSRTESQKKNIINNLRVIDGAIEQYVIATNGTMALAIDSTVIDPYIKGGYSAMRWPAGVTPVVGATASNGVSVTFDGTTFYSTSISTY